MIKTITALIFEGDGRPPMPWEASGHDAPLRAIVNRVTEVRRGEPRFNVLVEAWWESLPQAQAGAAAAPPGTELIFSAALDERVFAVEGNPGGGPLPAGHYKTLGAYHLGSGANGDAFWRYHVHVHGADVVEAAGDALVGYSLNRRTQALAGGPGFFAMFEMWWSDKAAFLGYPARSSTYVTASGKPPLDDFASYDTIQEFSVALEEI